MPKYTVTVPIWATATLRHVEGEDADAAISEAYPPSLCAQCAGMGDPTRSLDLSGDPVWEDAQALMEGEDGEVLAHEWGRQEKEYEEARKAENRKAQDQARDQRDGAMWRALLDALPALDLQVLADDVAAALEGSDPSKVQEAVVDALRDRSDDKERAALVAMGDPS